MVAHDAQDIVASSAAAEAVRSGGQGVHVKRPGKKRLCQEDQHCDDHHRKAREKDSGNGDGHKSQQASDKRKPTRRSTHVFSRKGYRDRDTSRECNRCSQGSHGCG
jgi:hypothetical protein